MRQGVSPVPGRAPVSAVMPSASSPDPQSRTRIGERRRTVRLAVSSLTLATRATVRALVLTVPVTKPRHSRPSAPAHLSQTAGSATQTGCGAKRPANGHLCASGKGMLRGSLSFSYIRGVARRWMSDCSVGDCVHRPDRTACGCLRSGLPSGRQAWRLAGNARVISRFSRLGRAWCSAPASPVDIR